MIYTSYFGNLKNLDGMQHFSVVRFNPSWVKAKHLAALAPSADLLQAYKTGLINEDQYTVCYNKQLESLDWRPLLALFDQFKSDSANCVLLCYEGPDKFCHRHLLAKFLKERFGYAVYEYGAMADLFDF